MGNFNGGKNVVRLQMEYEWISFVLLLVHLWYVTWLQ